MNEAVKQVLDKLTEVAPQAQEMFGRMSVVYMCRIVTAMVLAVIVAVVCIYVVVKIYHRYIAEVASGKRAPEYENDYSASEGIPTFICAILGISSLIAFAALLPTAISVCVDPLAAYIMHVLGWA